jgi:hypothetical protein
MAQQRMPKDGGFGALDLVRALAVLVVVVVLTVYLVDHYGQDETKAVAVLGVVASILGAVMGFSIGSTAGKAVGEKGKADAVKAGRSRLVEHLRNQMQPAGGQEGVQGAEDPRLERIRSSLDAAATE